MFVRLIVFALLFTICRTGKSATYYFSSSEGNDTRSNHQAKYPETPWQSIKKLNIILFSIQIGDSVLFKSGDIFHGTLEIVKSGSMKTPIFFGSYGSGEKPILTGFREIKDWLPKGENLFEVHLPEIKDALSTVIIDNSLQAMGRYPNSNATNGGYLTINSFSNNTIQSKEFKTTSNLAGGELVIRKNNWIIDRHLINSSSLNTINYDGSGSQLDPMVGYGFFIQNHLSTLDSHREWFYDKNSKKLLLYYLGEPSNGSIKVATLSEILIIRNKASNLIFENLSFTGSNGNLINLNGSSNIIFNNCNFENVGQNAINSVSSRKLTILNSTIKNSLNGGVFLGWNDLGVRIENSTFENIYNYAGMGKSGDMQGQALYMSETSSDVLIGANKFLNCGYNAINFSGNNITIKNNLIDTFCFIKDDGAGIYTFTGLKKTPFINRKILGNIIINGIGAISGTNPFGHYDLPYVEGIYLDTFVSGVEIDGNTISNVKSKGIFLNNANNITISNNKIINTGYSVYIKIDNLKFSFENIVVRNNDFIAITDSQIHYYVSTNFDDMANLGKFDDNIFFRPLNNSKTIYFQTPKINSSIDLETWKRNYGLDEKSWIVPLEDVSNHPSERKSSKMDFSFLFEYNHSSYPKSIFLPGTFIDLRGKNLSGKIEIPPYSSIILLKSKN